MNAVGEIGFPPDVMSAAKTLPMSVWNIDRILWAGSLEGRSAIVFGSPAMRKPLISAA
jgi:hypothetical protein